MFLCTKFNSHLPTNYEMAATKSTEKSSLISSQRSIKESGHSFRLDVSISRFVKSGKELVRRFGFGYLFSYVVGILFGSGVFISPGLVAQQTENMGIALLIWMISGMICIFGSLCFCELAGALKKAGGEYIFIKEAFGDVAGFCTIWAQSLIITPTALAVLAVTVAEYLIGPFYDLTSANTTYLVKIIAVSTVVLSVIINLISTSFVGKTQVFFTFLQTLSVLFFIILGIWKVSTGHTQNYDTMFNNSSKSNIGSISLALYNGLWAYDGWGMICTITEELHNPDRDLWLAIVTGIPFVIFCYLLINLAFMSVLTHNEIANSSTVATTFVEKILGRKVALIVPVAAALSCFSCLNASILIWSRALLSASREGHLPEPLSYIHADRKTPVPAILFISSLTIIWILALGNGTQKLVVYFSFAVWLTYGVAIFCVIVLRLREPDMERPFKVFILNPVLMTLVSFFLVIAPFFKTPIESAICCVCLLTALPVYFLLVWNQSCTPSWVSKWKNNTYRYIRFKFKLVPCVFMDTSKSIPIAEKEGKAVVYCNGYSENDIFV